MKTVKNKSAIIIVALGLAGFALFGCDGKGVNPPSNARLSVSQDTLNYDSTRTRADLVISNTGGDVLNWSFASWPAWVDPSDSSGTVDGNSNHIVTLTITRSLLSPGLNTGIVPLHGNGASVDVVLIAQQSANAVLGQPPDSLVFGVTLDSLTLTVLNTGGDTLHWSVSVVQTGTAFSAAPASGSTTGLSLVGVRFHRDGLDPGSYQAMLLINSDGGSGQVLLTGYVGGAGGYWLSYSQQSSFYYAPSPFDLYFIVRFDRPAGWQNFKVSSIRANFYTLSGAYDDVQWFCWGVVPNQGFLFPDLGHALNQSAIFDPVNGWNEWMVNWPLALTTFTVGYFQWDETSPAFPAPWFDATTVSARSYRVWQDSYGQPIADLLSDRDWSLEVFVEPIYTAAGEIPHALGQWLKPAKVIQTPSPTAISLPYLSRSPVEH